MRRNYVFAALLAVTVAVSGCASVSTLQDREMAINVPSQEFAAPKADVDAAVLKAIANLDYNLKEVKKSGNVTQVYFSKSMNAFSWGEVGRIDVKAIDATRTVVVIDSEKRMKTQITGTSKQEFAFSIFEQIRQNLR